MQSNMEALSTLMPDTRLAGRTALVTDSTSGIGEAIVRVLASSGAMVLVTGRDAGRTRRVVDDITTRGGSAHSLTADLRGSADEVRELARRARDVLGGRVDVLVNNAGIYPVGPTEALPDADLDAMLATNVRTPHLLVAALAPAMAARGDGVIVNIGSWMARVGTPFGAMYTATKAALEQLTRSWSAEYGPRGVRVNTVAPGVTSTPGNASAADVIEKMTKGTVADRPVRPIDIAYAVRYLASAEAAFIHATQLDVDGGIAHTRMG